MKNKTILALACAFLLSVQTQGEVPDSVWVRPTALADGSGLILQWSRDQADWQQVTQGRVLSSDYGPWGSGKKMYAPSMAQADDGLIAVVFQVNNHNAQFAVCSTRDFIHWRPQDYPQMKGVGQCLEPVVRWNDGTWTITFHNTEGIRYQTTSDDLVKFSAPQRVDEDAQQSVLRLPKSMLDAVKDNLSAYAARDVRHSELAKDDATRFAYLGDVRLGIKALPEQAKEISNQLMGIFFEDINYGADGGLWADLVQNGDFEYTPSDRVGDQNWNSSVAWSVQGKAEVEYVEDGISENNTHAARITIADRKGNGVLLNSGWDGIPVRKGQLYDLSLYAKGGPVQVSLVNGEKVLAKVLLTVQDRWQYLTATLRPVADCDTAALEIRPLKIGSLTVDMVSLMPKDTYKGHGLRRDLAETLAALHPRFMRFPGGCVVHGDGLSNIYDWKGSIGPVKDRKPIRNIWGYHQSRRLGYYEFFQMCEDMGMEPLPVLAAGVPCQNSSNGGNGQQGGIPMDEMPAYVQDVLDLIEWANGDASTEWGSKRAQAGHEKPFGLKMIGIGNEDLISPTFAERYLMICKAVHEKYPDIKICGTAGPFYYGSDYEEGWRLANENKDMISLVDEHYYLPPGWFIYNQDFYDHYDRTASHVYLGEWAAHGPGRKSTIETALSEALYYLSLERNGDVVDMSSYAPLLAKEGHTQWNPDMIYFTNTEVKPTVGYWAQMMCGQSQGDTYIPTAKSLDANGTLTDGVQQRLGCSLVKDSSTGKTYLKMVNLLPKNVLVEMNLAGVISGRHDARMTRLQGAYDSTDARPERGTLPVSPYCTLVLPAYSFTLLEF